MKMVHRRLVYRDDIIFTGYLPEGIIEKVLGSAVALTMVSFYEGFCLPVVEAMRCEVPVIASGKTAIPEIAGDAAIYADPDDFPAIGNAMIQVVSSAGLREKLVAEGRSRYPVFSWDKSARDLWSTIENVVNNDAQSAL
jgi:glycosyltransferase involved in cell wall biosynthesis